MSVPQNNGYRLKHHSKRVPFDTDSRSAKAYFDRIKAEYNILYPAVWPDNLYHYELAYYKKTFADWVAESEQKHKKSRHLERIKTMEQIYGNLQHCPEELTLQIGIQKDKIPEETIQACMEEYLTWGKDMEDDNGCGPIILFAGIRKTEPYQMLIRRVWVYREETGVRKISQTKVLKNMGFAAYAGNEDVRYQNSKMEFDQVCRKVMEEICTSHGLQVETIPVVRTLRQAVAWRDAVIRESDEAKTYFQKLIERENEAKIEDLEQSVTQTEDGKILMPALTYRMYILKELLGELYQAQANATDVELIRVKNAEHEAFNDMQEAESRLTTAEMEYAALQIGLHMVGADKKEE